MEIIFFINVKLFGARSFTYLQRYVEALSELSWISVLLIVEIHSRNDQIYMRSNLVKLFNSFIKLRTMLRTPSNIGCSVVGSIVWPNLELWASNLSVIRYSGDCLYFWSGLKGFMMTTPRFVPCLIKRILFYISFHTSRD